MLSAVARRSFSTTLRLCDRPRKKSSVFFRPDVQEALRRLTGRNDGKIFDVARRGQQINPPTYRFVTTAELEELSAAQTKIAEEKLQMPPVMDERAPINRVLASDQAIQGYDDGRLLFTDISYGVHDRDRLIVVREADGTLREAEWQERDRVNQIYFPKEGRKLDLPAMFEPTHLAEILGPSKYEYILDRCCVQFEPDHPLFIQTAETVYSHIDENGNYDSLKSTRHYGPMVFFFCWDQRRPDDLICHYLKKSDVQTASEIAAVFKRINQDKDEKPCLESLRAYIERDATKGGKVHVALEAALEAIEKEEKTKTDIKQAHGTNFAE